MKKDKYAIIVDRPEGGTTTIYDINIDTSYMLEDIFKLIGLSYIVCSEIVEVSKTGKRKYL